VRDGDDAKLRNVSVISNSSSYNYAGLYLAGDNATLDQITIRNNTAQNQYGGLYVYGADIIFNNLSLISNTAGINYGGAYLQGSYAGGRTKINHFQVTNNRVLTTTDCTGGGIYINSRNSTLQNGIVSGNRGCIGSGMYMAGSFYTLTNILVTDNYANAQGGGLYLNGDGLIKNCYIVGNQADAGGGVYIRGLSDDYTVINSFIANNQVSVHSGGLYARGDIVLVNNTFVNNDMQGVVHNASNPSYVMLMTNTIVASHTVGIENQGTGMVFNDYTLFAYNTDNYSGTVQNGPHNIGGDSAFTNPDARDYHITQDSAAINWGATIPWLTDDYDGEPRPNGASYDIGADESYETPVEGAFFTYTPPDPIFGQHIRFHGDVLTGTYPITYEWDFGDGARDEGRYPLHLYAAPGLYTVILTVSNVANSIHYYAVYSDGVNVVVRGVLLEPDWFTATVEGSLVHLQHVLTNTGSVSDSYSLQAASSQGWPVSVTAQSGPLLAGEEATVIVTTSLPWGSGGQIGQTIITATSNAAEVIYDTATDEIIVYAASMWPDVALAPSRSDAAFPSQTLIYQHILTNTGDGPDYFHIEAVSALSWTLTLSPSGVLQLNSGQTATLQLQITIPTDAPPRQTDVATITATSFISPAVSAWVTDTTTVLTITRSAHLEPDWLVVAAKSGPVSFTHILTNAGNFTDSFFLTATSSEGWALDWTASPTGPLGAAEIKTVWVTVTVPSGALNVINYTLITATSQADELVYDTATDGIVVPWSERLRLCQRNPRLSTRVDQHGGWTRLL